MEEDTEQDLSHINWSYPEYISALPTKSLATADLAMDYFALSTFWDQQSNNSQLRTQRRIEDPTYGSEKEKIELLAFNQGFEYIVAHARPPELFTIHRRPVNSDGTRGDPTHIYFILYDKIYMAPSLFDVMSTRLKNTAWLLERTFDDLEKAHPAANPRASSTWMAAAEKQDKEKEKEKKEDKDVPNAFLINALRATEVAVPKLEELATSSRPERDVLREQRELEAMAQAAVRPNAPRPQRAAPSPLPPVAPSFNIGTPFALGTPQVNGTPSALTPGAAMTPRPRMGSLSFAASNFAPSLPGDSPAS